MRHFLRLAFKTEAQTSHFGSEGSPDITETIYPVLNEVRLPDMARAEYRWPSGDVEKVTIFLDYRDRGSLGTKIVPYFTSSFRGKEIRVDLEKGDFVHLIEE